MLHSKQNDFDQVSKETDLNAWESDNTNTKEDYLYNILVRISINKHWCNTSRLSQHAVNGNWLSDKKYALF